VNGTPVATTSTLPPSFFIVGDRVVVRVTANDGEVDGPTATSPAATIIMCTPPAALSSGSGSMSTFQRDPSVRSIPSAADLSLALAAAASEARSPVARGAAESEGTAGSSGSAEPFPSQSPLSISETNVCSIGTDGSLYCSGSEDTGLTSPPEGAFSQVKVELDYACAIRSSDGSIACWGEPLVDVGQLSPPEGSFSQIDLALDVACGVRASGEIACWGDETLGLSSPPEGRFTHLDVSDSYACAIRADGEVRCWGPLE
jgi:hypothetical protein